MSKADEVAKVLTRFQRGDLVKVTPEFMVEVQEPVLCSTRGCIVDMDLDDRVALAGVVGRIERAAIAPTYYGPNCYLVNFRPNGPIWAIPAHYLELVEP